MNAITLLQSCFILLIAIRLACMNRSGEKSSCWWVRLLIWLAIIFCLAASFQRLNGQYGLPHMVDLFLLIISFILVNLRHFRK